MKDYRYFILLLIGIAGCNFKSGFPKYLGNCDSERPLNNGFVYRDSLNLYELEIPKNWKVQTSINEPYRTCMFQDTMVDLYNFESLTVTDDIRKGYDYDKSFEEVLKKIKKDNELEIIDLGKGINNFRNANWILYQSSEFVKDDLNSIVFAIFIENENHYFWILANVLGDKEPKSRMCNLVKMINSFKTKESYNNK